MRYIKAILVMIIGAAALTTAVGCRASGEIDPHGSSSVGYSR